MSFIGVFWKKYEEERLEASMRGPFASDHGADNVRARRKLLKRAWDRPEETVLLLLRNFENDDERVRRYVLEALTELAAERRLLSVIMEEMAHPDREVRKAVQSFLGKLVGPHAAIYASIYEQTMLQLAMSRRKDVPVEDIASLAELSKETFMDGEVMEATRDIALCLDRARHRYRSSEQLRVFLADSLKMVPDLSRMGVFSSSIEEPLHRAMRAARERSFDETREMIEERSRESELRRDLCSIVEWVGASVTYRPLLDTGSLTEKDREELAIIHRLAVSIESMLDSGDAVKATAQLHEHIVGMLRRYRSTLAPRARSGEQGALAVMYFTGLACVKMASRLLPVTAEGAYLEGFRNIERAASIQVVVLPGEITGD